MTTNTKQVERILNRGLTVAELLDVLESCNPDARVVFVCDYGDHCHTQQALPVGEAEELHHDYDELRESAYSQSGLALCERRRDDDDEDDEPGHGGQNFDVVVLK